MSNPTLPKSLRRFSKRIASYHTDADGALFVGYAYGWKSCTDMMGCVHGDVSNTVTEAGNYARNAVVCDCEECVAHKAKGGKS